MYFCFQEKRVIIIEDGISKYLAKEEERKKRDFRYKSANETLQKREDDEMTEKVTWYKGWKKKRTKKNRVHKNKRRGQKRKHDDNKVNTSELDV